LPWENPRRNEPSVEGARNPPNTRGSAPCRNRSISSIESAPASMPATRHTIFKCAFTPTFAANRTGVSLTSLPSPHCSASRSTGISPAHDTKFASSKAADVLPASCNNCIYGVPSLLDLRKLRQLP
jgi:hypothetical protein